MRLSRVDSGHELAARITLGLIRRFAGEPPDVVKTLCYRPQFFGRRWSALTHEIMRGESPWTVGERELFAAFVSSLNQCVF